MITITITEEEEEMIINMIEEKESEIYYDMYESGSNIAAVRAQKEKRKINSIRNKIWEEQNKRRKNR